MNHIPRNIRAGKTPCAPRCRARGAAGWGGGCVEPGSFWQPPARTPQIFLFRSKTCRRCCFSASQKRCQILNRARFCLCLRSDLSRRLILPTVYPLTPVYLPFHGDQSGGLPSRSMIQTIRVSICLLAQFVGYKRDSLRDG